MPCKHRPTQNIFKPTKCRYCGISIKPANTVKSKIVNFVSCIPMIAMYAGLIFCDKPILQNNNKVLMTIIILLAVFVPYVFIGPMCIDYEPDTDEKDSREQKSAASEDDSQKHEPAAVDYAQQESNRQGEP